MVNLPIFLSPNCKVFFSPRTGRAPLCWDAVWVFPDMPQKPRRSLGTSSFIWVHFAHLLKGWTLNWPVQLLQGAGAGRVHMTSWHELLLSHMRHMSAPCETWDKQVDNNNTCRVTSYELSRPSNVPPTDHAFLLHVQIYKHKYIPCMSINEYQE